MLFNSQISRGQFPNGTAINSHSCKLEALVQFMGVRSISSHAVHTELVRMWSSLQIVFYAVWQIPHQKYEFLIILSGR